jgi:predicted DNA-binding transcriptional regulator AlpA
MNMDQESVEKLALRDHEAAVVLGVSVSSLRSWRSQGRGPSFSRLGRRVVYPLKELEKFLRETLVSGGREATSR